MMLADPDAIAAAYTGTRTRSTGVLRDAGPDAAVAERSVPACPQWTVRQLAAHLCGVCDDVLAGNLTDAGSDPWTDAQVTRYENTPLTEILDRWDEVGPQVEAVIPAVPPAPTSQMVFDATTHEHDLRGALGAPGARDSDSIAVGFAFLAKSLDRLIKAQGLPTLEITAANQVLTLGDIPAGSGAEIHLAGSSFELFRAFGGRRTLDQVRALDWSADPTPYLDAFFGGILKPPAEPLAE